MTYCRQQKERGGKRSRPALPEQDEAAEASAPQQSDALAQLQVRPVCVHCVSVNATGVGAEIMDTCHLCTSTLLSTICTSCLQLGALLAPHLSLEHAASESCARTCFWAYEAKRVAKQHTL